MTSARIRASFRAKFRAKFCAAALAAIPAAAAAGRPVLAAVLAFMLAGAPWFAQAAGGPDANAQAAAAPDLFSSPPHPEPGHPPRPEAGRAPHPEAEHGCLNQKERRAETESGKLIRLSAAIRAAQRRQPGTVVRARLCRSANGLVYVLTVLAHDGKVARISVDAMKSGSAADR